MKKKESKKLKKKDKSLKSDAKATQVYVRDLKRRIAKLEDELKQREKTIQTLTRQLKEGKAKNYKKKKPGKNVLSNMFSKNTSRVAITQRQAWKRHGYLRDRYEYHLGKNQDKSNARILADQDLREMFGEDAGFSEQELEDILS